jgi:hypothetical protein
MFHPNPRPACRARGNPPTFFLPFPSTASTSGCCCTPPRPRATHCCITHFVSTASSAVCSVLRSIAMRHQCGTLAAYIAHTLKRPFFTLIVYILGMHTEVQRAPRPRAVPPHLASACPSAKAGKNSSAAPCRGLTSRARWSKRVAPPASTSFRYTSRVAWRWKRLLRAMSAGKASYAKQAGTLPVGSRFA